MLQEPTHPQGFIGVENMNYVGSVNDNFSVFVPERCQRLILELRIFSHRPNQKPQIPIIRLHHFFIISG